MQQQSLFKVPSMSGSSIEYTVDLEKKTCDCPAFLNKHAFQGTPCKHMLAVAAQQGIELDTIPVTVGKQSSLVVEPAASLPRFARQHGARLVIINRDPTDQDSSAHAVLHEPLGAALAEIDRCLNRS